MGAGQTAQRAADRQGKEAVLGHRDAGRSRRQRTLADRPQIDAGVGAEQEKVQHDDKNETHINQRGLSIQNLADDRNGGKEGAVVLGDAGDAHDDAGIAEDAALEERGHADRQTVHPDGGDHGVGLPVLHKKGVDHAQHRAGDHGDERADIGVIGVVGAHDTEKRAEQHHAFQRKVQYAGFFAQQPAERGQQDRRGGS